MSPTIGLSIAAVTGWMAALWYRHRLHQRSSKDATIRSFFDAASQAIIAVRGDGRIALVNRSAEEMFGYSRQELIGMELEALIPERFRRAHAHERSGYFQAPRARQMDSGLDVRALRKDGSEFPAEIALSHIETGEGKLAMALVSDISRRKSVEQQLARAMEELRHSNAELEQFAYVASHDLQEPLRMITGYLNVLERRCAGQLDAPAHEFIRFAVDGAERMRAMIQEILHLSRVGSQAVRRFPVPADEIVTAAIENLRAAIEESSAEIERDALPEILADPGLLALVFQNLVSNAIKFRGTHIRISAQRRQDEWIFSVKDNGIGMDPQNIDRIFRIFERLHDSAEYPGAGVGLAIAKKVVERHGGRIWVESQPGGGSTFYFSLPEEP